MAATRRRPRCVLCRGCCVIRQRPVCQRPRRSRARRRATVTGPPAATLPADCCPCARHGGSPLTARPRSFFEPAHRACRTDRVGGAQQSVIVARRRAAPHTILRLRLGAHRSRRWGAARQKVNLCVHADRTRIWHTKFRKVQHLSESSTRIIYPQPGPRGARWCHTGRRWHGGDARKLPMGYHSGTPAAFVRLVVPPPVWYTW